MGKYVSYEGLSRVVAYPDNEAIFVASDIEDRAISHRVGVFHGMAPETSLLLGAMVPVRRVVTRALC